MAILLEYHVDREIFVIVVYLEKILMFTLLGNLFLIKWNIFLCFFSFFVAYYEATMNHPTIVWGFE